MPFGPQDRGDRLEALSRTELDILVVGGGITGVATARDAAMRGFRVACVEMEDFAYGTSSRSSKLIHGGLRYLEQANFRLVFEGTRERATLRKNAPHLVRPIKFLVPVYEGAKHGVLALGVGLWMYDQLAGKRRYGRHSRHNPAQLEALEPTLRQEGLRGGAVYFDCMTDDARLCVENAVSAHRSGAIMLNRVRFAEAVRDSGGRVVGAIVEDRLSGDRVEVRCKVLVHCAGPWTDDVLQRSGESTGMLRTTKGIHVLVPWSKMPVNHAVVMASRSDRRVLFAIPRGRVTLIGTTDTDYAGDPDDVHATPEDVEYLMEAVRHYFGAHAPTTADIVATYAGLRPMVRDDAESPYDVSREHTVVQRDDGTVTIAGGKYTTYRLMASDVVRAAMRSMGLKRNERPRCPTVNARLPGGVGFGVDEVDSAVSALTHVSGLPEDVSRHLVDTYGGRHGEVAAAWGGRVLEGKPFCWGEIDHAVHEESALTIADVLIRRVPIYYEAPDQGLECVSAIAERMGSVLGWDDAERRQQTVDYEAVVAQNRRWKV